MTKAKSTSDAIAKLEEKDGPAEGTQAYSNELLAARGGNLDKGALKEAIEANDPSKTHAASHPEPADPDKPVKTGAKSEHQAKSVNR